jgi:cytochrome b subunit of formate dehydrogenase
VFLFFLGEIFICTKNNKKNFYLSSFYPYVSLKIKRKITKLYKQYKQEQIQNFEDLHQLLSTHSNKNGIKNSNEMVKFDCILKIIIDVIKLEYAKVPASPKYK